MADTYIKYNDHSISSAFKDHYIVPDYQREYVWTDEQVEQLMADLLDAYNTDNKKAYFLGTIVTYDSGSQFELIDGQQRLTTFFVLLCAIKKFYVNCGEQTSVIENLIYSPTMNSECYSNLNHTSAAHTTPPVTGVLPLCTRLRRVRRNNPPWRSL